MGRFWGNNVTRMLAISILPMLIAGCEGTHIYNETNAKLATKTKDSYAKVDLLATQKTEKASLEKLLAAEIANSRASFNYQRDLILFNIAEFDWKTKSLEFGSQSCKAPPAVSDRVLLRDQLDKCYLEQRANALGAKNQAELANLASLSAGIMRPRVEIEVIRERLKRTGWATPPTCDNLPAALPPEFAALTPEEQSALNLQRQSLERACQNFARRIPDGEIKNVQKEINKAQAVITDIKAEGEVIAKQLKDLASQYQDAVKARGKSAEDRQKAIIEEVEKIRKYLGKAESIGSRIGAEEIFANELYSSADVLLQAGAGQDVSADKIAKDEDLARAVLVAKATPHLAAEMGAAIDAYRAPPTASLLMSQRQAIIQRENVAERVTLSKRRLEILNKKSAALEEEARLLNQANIHAEDFKRCSDDKCRKKSTFLAMDALSRSIVVARAEAYEMNYQLAHVDNLEIIATNEYALKSWDNLIGPPIALLDSYHAAGIKPEAVGDLIFKAMAVGALGVIAVKAD